MSNIQFIYTVTPEQWSKVYSDLRLTQEYLKNNSDQTKLANDLEARIKSICAEFSLPCPQKIIISSETTGPCMPNSKELFIHPLTFVASNLDRTTMTQKHQEIYKHIEDFIQTNERLENYFKDKFEKEENELEGISDQAAAIEVFQQASAVLKDELKDYEFILPGKELEEQMKICLAAGQSFEMPTCTNTADKVAYAAISVFSGITAAFVAKEMTRDPITLSIASSIVTAATSYVCLSLDEFINKLTIATERFLKNIESMQKPAEGPTIDQKIAWIKIFS